MNKTYKRWQLLLYNEEGKPGGFTRFEQSGSQVTVEARAEGVGDGARLLLVPAGQGEPLSLGAVSKCAAKCTLPWDELDGYTQVAIVRGDKLLLFGGEGADYLAMRKRITRPRQPYPQTAARAEATMAAPSRIIAMDTRNVSESLASVAVPDLKNTGAPIAKSKPETVSAQQTEAVKAVKPAPAISGPEYTVAMEQDGDDEPAAIAGEMEPVPASGPEYTVAMEQDGDDEPAALAGEMEPVLVSYPELFGMEPAEDAEPAAGPPRESPAPFISVTKASKAPDRFEQEGWVITRIHSPNAPERIEGRLTREDGSTVYILQGVAGTHAPEPPPGLSGYVWDAGFWVLVSPVEVEEDTLTKA